MPVKPVVLWTDALVYVLVVTLAAFFSYVRSKPHLLAPWQQVLRRPLAVAALVVLSAYVVVGLLDSVHFRPPLPQQGEYKGEDKTVHYSVEVLSLLDIVLTPLRNTVERSYSSPLATHLYSKELQQQADGSRVRDYARLKYGGAHLVNPQADYAADIAQRSVNALLQAAVAWAVLVLLWSVFLARRARKKLADFLRDVARGKTALPWRVIFVCVGALLLMITVIIELGLPYHLLGTDKVGNDVLYLSLKSIRTGLVIGTLTTLVMLPFAVLLGIMAGHYRGWIDDVIQYIYTTLNSIPGVLLIAAAILSVDLYIANNPGLFETVVERADLRLLFLCLILGITSWTGLCRLLRGETLKLRELDYIQAATAFGMSNNKIITRHILPNVMHIVLIAVVLDFSGLVLAEAVLSYIGVGVDPSMISWGNMINSARLEMAREPVVWWSLLAALGFMFFLVLAANLFSDAVRDAFDPRTGRGIH
ncbi:MAG: ABC transporter permease [Gammaproteobacteria bacterium]|nr:ABC transporter permease [Gammaproteobacteria bacterium]